MTRESMPTNVEHKHEGGPSAFRAVWLQEKLRGEHSKGEGLPIIAESSVAKTLKDGYPDAWSIDSGFENLGGYTRQALAEKYPEHEWVILARKGDAPIVTVENLKTGDFLPNDQTVYLEGNWENNANPFAEKIRRIQGGK